MDVLCRATMDTLFVFFWDVPLLSSEHTPKSLLLRIPTTQGTLKKNGVHRVCTSISSVVTPLRYRRLSFPGLFWNERSLFSCPFPVGRPVFWKSVIDEKRSVSSVFFVTEGGSGVVVSDHVSGLKVGVGRHYPVETVAPQSLRVYPLRLESGDDLSLFWEVGETITSLASKSFLLD